MIYDVPVKTYLLEGDKNVSDIWNIRNNILQSIDVVVPEDLFEFFLIYRNRVASTSNIKVSATKVLESFKPDDTIIWYSGGSDSEVLKDMFPDLGLYRVTEFVKHKDPMIKREFQMCLVSYMIRKSCYIGISFNDDVLIQKDQYSFEYTQDFLNLWNRTFPTKVEYPIANMSKIEVYRRLGNKAETVDVCERDNPPCGNCFKCFEKYHIVKALYGKEICALSSRITDKVKLDYDTNALDFLGIVATLKELEQQGYHWR